MGVAADKIDFLLGNIDGRGKEKRNIFEPVLDGFGVINPRTSQKSKAKILTIGVDVAKTEFGVLTKSNRESRPVLRVEMEIFDDLAGLDGFFELEKGGVMSFGKGMEFVPFDLVGNKKIDNIVNVTDGADKIGKGVSVEIKIVSATTGRRENFFPGSKMRKAGLGEDFGILAKKD